MPVTCVGLLAQSVTLRASKVNIKGPGCFLFRARVILQKGCAHSMQVAADIEQILRRHERWLESGETRGSRADLSGAQLDGADFSGVDLSDAILVGASLKQARFNGAQLVHTNLRDACLQEADLAEANLLLTDFTRADLQRAASLAGTGPHALWPMFSGC
jgi:uncharacterized protein YjbI with pentapeptide repeats